jgi:hypothetical protein
LVKRILFVELEAKMCLDARKNRFKPGQRPLNVCDAAVARNRRRLIHENGD